MLSYPIPLGTLIALGELTAFAVPRKTEEETVVFPNLGLFPKVSYFPTLLMSIYDAASKQN
jgi:hypothetical protein